MSMQKCCTLGMERLLFFPVSYFKIFVKSPDFYLAWERERKREIEATAHK